MSRLTESTSTLPSGRSNAQSRGSPSIDVARNLTGFRGVIFRASRASARCRGRTLRHPRAKSLSCFVTIGFGASSPNCQRIARPDRLDVATDEPGGTRSGVLMEDRDRPLLPTTSVVPDSRQPDQQVRPRSPFPGRGSARDQIDRLQLAFGRAYATASVVAMSASRRSSLTRSRQIPLRPERLLKRLAPSRSGQRQRHDVHDLVAELDLQQALRGLLGGVHHLDQDLVTDRSGRSNCDEPQARNPDVADAGAKARRPRRPWLRPAPWPRRNCVLSERSLVDSFWSASNRRAEAYSPADRTWVLRSGGIDSRACLKVRLMPREAAVDPRLRARRRDRHFIKEPEPVDKQRSLPAWHGRVVSA